jgi:hypothetical protein
MAANNDHARGMCHAAFLIAFGAFGGYLSEARSTAGSLLGVTIGVVAAAVILRVITGSWVLFGNPR